ncbi:MAG: putative molibdopterin-dependent oxidoreductase YjgC [Chloroflexi bacterium]|nr:MAG: putative molibdopterin-dependent oxidoreductase YjgC [Chloroflexota bacterium]
MTNIIINGNQVNAEAGRPLVEILKENGFPITNLCYIDGLDPYAGCRTCVVEIEGAKPTSIQLSCTTNITEGMVVNTESNKTKEIRQSVMSFITTNHPDRCLTCHRRVHCQPGEICLRDDVVTHRCLTCAKNYRCELQTATELIDQGEWKEPWINEERTYYETTPPKPDRTNPFLEFDPQMCILCTRCVRACADIRHTGAISLAGKGFETKIAFGAGGQVHESNCDFCGACIDVCPTATLMEKPNKWNGLATDWTNSVCNGCSMNCTISYGISNNGEPVIVRPVSINKTSRDQICVRGRFGYSEINIQDRNFKPYERIGDKLVSKDLNTAVDSVAKKLKNAIKKYGPQSIGIIASPFSTNEDAAFLNFFATDIVKTNNLDYIDGENYRAIIDTWEGISKHKKLPADSINLDKSKLIIAIAPDLEESHQITSLRIKDAVTNNNATLILISPKWGELKPFAKSWIQIKPGDEAILLEELTQCLLKDTDTFISKLEYIEKTSLQDVFSILKKFKQDRNQQNESTDLAIVFAPPNYYVSNTKNILINQAEQIGNLATALINEQASNSILYLPNEANVVGLDDMNIRPIDDGLNFNEMIDGIGTGKIKCLIIHNDNPLIRASNKTKVKKALQQIETLIIIDSTINSASKIAHFLLPDSPFYMKEGTTTNTSSYIFKHNFNQSNLFKNENININMKNIMIKIAQKIIEKNKDLSYSSEQQIKKLNKNYSKYPNFISGNYRAINKENTSYRLSSISKKKMLSYNASNETSLLVAKTLFTSRELTSIGSLQSDALNRESKGMMNSIDASNLGVNDNEKIIISTKENKMELIVNVSDQIIKGTIFVPQYLNEGEILSFLNQNKNEINIIKSKN